MNSIKQLLQRDEEVKYNETPDRKSALIGFLLGFVGYMYIFPTLLMTLFIKIFHLTQESPLATRSFYSLLAQVISGALVLIVMFFFVSRKEMKNAVKNFDKKTIFLGMKYFLISYVLVLVWNMIYMLFGGTITDNANQESLNIMMKETPFLALTLTCVIAPLIEEMIFRFYMYKGIEDQNPTVALFLTAFLFAFVHLFASIEGGTFIEDLKTFPAYFIPSLVMTFAYYKHRKLGVSVVCHITNNVFAAIMFYLQPFIMGSQGQGEEIVEAIVRCFLG